MRPWTTAELRVLRLFTGLGRNGLASLLERSPGSISAKAKEEGISLEEISNDYDITPEILDLLRRVRETPSLAICPNCCRRLARMKSTGFCRTCHLEQLVARHEERIDEKIAERKLDQVRQAAHRLRICEGCGRHYFPRTSSSNSLCPRCRK